VRLYGCEQDADRPAVGTIADIDLDTVVVSEDVGSGLRRDDRPTARANRIVFGVLPALAAVAVLRARFVVAPLTVDEGGYMGIARAWGRGARLYDDVWVDRPQGLLVAYRFLNAVGLGTPVGVRLLAIAACAVGVVACGHIAALLVGERARLPAGLFVAVFTSLPQIEGHTANSELLSASLGAAALALCLHACRNSTGDRWLLLAAGVVGGAAISTKQSAFDALGAAFIAVLIMGAAGKSTLQRVRAAGVLACGVAIPLGLCAFHGALTGWDRWWYAVAGYRLSQRSAFADARFDRIDPIWELLKPSVLPLAATISIAAVAGVVWSPASRRAMIVLATWCLLAAAAFMLGGQFFRHYWTILAFPAATVGGAAIGAVRPHAARALLAAVVLIGPVHLTTEAMRLPRSEIGPVLHGDGRLIASEQVADWFDAHAAPGDQIYVLCASAAVYGDTDADPPYPYIWLDGVRQIPGALERLTALLSSPTRPRFVAAFQQPNSCDASGRLASVLADHYAVLATDTSIRILEARD